MKKRDSRSALVALGLTVAAPSLVFAQEVYIPLEGFITDNDEMPVDGTFDIEIRLIRRTRGAVAVGPRTATVIARRIAIGAC